MADDFLGVAGAIGAARAPSVRPAPGKRRPQPRGSSRPACAAGAKYAAAADAREAREEPAERAQGAAGDAGDAGALGLQLAAAERTERAELAARCERHDLELAELRQQFVSLGGEAEAGAGGAGSAAATPRPHAAPPAGLAARPGSPRAERAERATQTEDEDLHAQREQLEAMCRDAGDKGRELRRAQESARLLRLELHEQRLVSEQYHVHVDVLEQQLRAALTQRRQAIAEAPRGAAGRGPAAGPARLATGVARGGGASGAQRRRSPSASDDGVSSVDEGGDGPADS